MVAYTKPQQRKREESERIRGDKGQIKFIDLRFVRWQVVRFREARTRQDAPRLGEKQTLLVIFTSGNTLMNSYQCHTPSYISLNRWSSWLLGRGVYLSNQLIHDICWLT